MAGFMFFIFLMIFVIVILSRCIRIVPQAQDLVIERLGAYTCTCSVGVHFLMPFVDRVARRLTALHVSPAGRTYGRKRQVLGTAPAANEP
ncbi:MAG: hypothetical protein LUC94_01030 [Clostridiales bacterium]|nr:hypothetical protein [Clostridiales bacterium]